jgi:transposase InsO family protein
MLKKAIDKLCPDDRPLLHSDQGWQYRMPAYRQQLAARQITQNMSRKGNCLDTSVGELWPGSSPRLRRLAVACRDLNSLSRMQKAPRCATADVG